MDLKGDSLFLDGDSAHYIISVLRCKKGDDLLVFDGQSRFFKGVIGEIGKNSLTIIGAPYPPPETESSLDLILCQGLLKGSKMDTVIQKATELGIKRIIPMATERCQLHETRKLFRWHKIALEASRQCGRVVVPDISPVMPVMAVTSLLTASGAASFIFYERGGANLKALNPPKQGVQCYVLVGPEGGFTPEELSVSTRAGATAVSFGRRILRGETAAISAVTLLQFLYGDLSP
ncbi:MAG: 16S rRNA (uracil(1498)-N(3))-methyltransferase [Nitrospirae bacterium]|nr:16S rRNA (uracil(1498)-N(3))-methyltransferase [Nitrospirota bacterium]